MRCGPGFRQVGDGIQLRHQEMLENVLLVSRLPKLFEIGPLVHIFREVFDERRHRAPDNQNASPMNSKIILIYPPSSGGFALFIIPNHLVIPQHPLGFFHVSVSSCCASRYRIPGCVKAHP